MTPKASEPHAGFQPPGAIAWRAGDAPLAVPPNVSGRAVTVLVRLGATAGSQSGEVLSWRGRAGRLAVRFAWGVCDAAPALTVEVGMDVREEPLRLALPAAALDEGKAAVVVLRLAGLKLELYLDGVLVDEEWPLGALPPPQGQLLTGPAADEIVLWGRALEDGEIVQLSGGREGLAIRERRILGPEQPVGQYWKPRGFNLNVGDCMPFYHRGRFHLFYLWNRRRHMSRWGLGGHEWAHLSTTDLISWESHPIAVPLTEENEGSMCTGSLFFAAGTYYAFHAVRTADRSASPICASTGTDCIHFTKHPPLAALTAPYKPEDARDPVVFQDPATGLFHLLLTTGLAGITAGDGGGCLAHLVSTNLRQWAQREPFLVPGLPGQPECPDYFEWHGWHYLLFSNQGVTTYRMSQGPLGPWERPKADRFEGPDVMVMKTAAFTGDRRIGAAFTREEGYGGRLVLREITQNPDGTLGAKWPAELVPPTS